MIPGPDSFVRLTEDRGGCRNDHPRHHISYQFQNFFVKVLRGASRDVISGPTDFSTLQEIVS